MRELPACAIFVGAEMADCFCKQFSAKNDPLDVVYKMGRIRESYNISPAGVV
jgi:hypothetical protein